MVHYWSRGMQNHILTCIGSFCFYLFFSFFFNITWQLLHEAEYHFKNDRNWGLCCRMDVIFHISQTSSNSSWLWRIIHWILTNQKQKYFEWMINVVFYLCTWFFSSLYEIYLLYGYLSFILNLQTKCYWVTIGMKPI